MVDKDFPCKTCKHSADRHYINIGTETGICTGCESNKPDYAEQYHLFVGDNLAFLELQKRRQDILNEY